MDKINFLNLKWNVKIGGVLEHYVQVGSSLDPNKFSVINLFVINPKKEKSLEIIQKLNGEVLTLRSKYDITVVPRIAKIIRSHRIDVVHVVENSTSFVIGLVRMISRYPFKIIISTQGLPVHDTKFRQFLVRQFFIASTLNMKFFAQRVIAASESIRKLLIRRGVGEKKISVVYNGIDPARYLETVDVDQKKVESGFPEGYNIVGITARLTPVKGIEYLIRAMAVVLKTYPHSYLVIVGDGYLRSQLEEEASRLEIEKNVIFTGFRKDIPALLKTFDVFVLPSFKEGLPFSVIEAMASKKPVVATDVEGNNEVVEDGVTGIFVPTADEKRLAQAIMRLLGDKELAKDMGNQGFKRFKKMFVIDSLIKNLEEIIEDVVKGSHSDNIDTRKL